MSPARPSRCLGYATGDCASMNDGIRSCGQQPRESGRKDARTPWIGNSDVIGRGDAQGGVAIQKACPTLRDT